MSSCSCKVLMNVCIEFEMDGTCNEWDTLKNEDAIFDFNREFHSMMRWSVVGVALVLHHDCVNYFITGANFDGK